MPACVGLKTWMGALRSASPGEQEEGTEAGVAWVVG